MDSWGRARGCRTALRAVSQNDKGSRSKDQSPDVWNRRNVVDAAV